MLPLLEAEAKERQGTRSDLNNIPEILPESKNDSRDQAAAMVGVSGTVKGCTYHGHPLHSLRPHNTVAKSYRIILSGVAIYDSS